MPISQTTDPATGAKVYAVTGNGGPFQTVGAAGAPLELFLGNAGTAMRPLAAALCFGNGNFVLVRHTYASVFLLIPTNFHKNGARIWGRLGGKSAVPYSSSIII